MSHFTVLVIGENVEAQLQPYHEYECTGIKDQYVLDVDKTDEVSEWLQRKIYYGPKKDGGQLDCQYHQDRADELLSSYEEITRSEMFAKEGRDEHEEIIDWHGYELKEGKWIRFTNPNAKWDWWVVGGRWTGFFTLKQGTTGEVGKPGLMTPIAKPGYCDSTLKRNIDFDSMKMTQQLKAAEEWHAVNDVIKKSDSFRTWDEITEKKNYGDKQRALYNSQPEVIAFNKINSWFRSKVEDYLIPKEEYVQKEVDTVAVTFAVVKDGVWYERGKMGWWACVSDEKEQDDWNKEFWALIDGLPDDTLLTVVDCHI